MERRGSSTVEPTKGHAAATVCEPLHVESLPKTLDHEGMQSNTDSLGLVCLKEYFFLSQKMDPTSTGNLPSTNRVSFYLLFTRVSRVFPLLSPLGTLPVVHPCRCE